MSSKNSSVIYKLQKHGYEEMDPEEWSDMAICDAYDDAVSERQPGGVKISCNIRSTLKQSQKPMQYGSKIGDNASSHSKQTQLGYNSKVFHKGKSSPEPSDHLYKPGDSCIALYSEDNLYYPCTVISVNKEKKTCLLEYDGYGNTENVNYCDMYTEEQWKSRTNESSNRNNEDVISGSSSTDTSSCTGTSSSSTEGTSSDVTQDIYPDPRGRRKRLDSRRGRHGKRHFEHPPNFPNFGPNPFFGLPPPPPSFDRNINPELCDDSLSSMLMSWYMAGFHTGYYQGLRGSVPPYYRDIHDALCPGPSDKISRDKLTQVLKKSGLDNGVLSQIWESLGCRDGIVTRNILYKALALIAFAQQGKTVSEKLLENFSGTELPKPDLGTVHDIKSMLQQKKKSPTLLHMTFTQIQEVDKIQVLKAPEKKGIFLKHVEYEVKSARFNSTVLRRYNDFLAFHEILQMRFPYRMLPKLPPKKVIGADRTFIEARRKSLRRFLTLVCTHPAMHEDPVIRFFLTFSGNEVVHKIKEQFRGAADEFMMSPYSNEAKSLVPADTQAQFAVSKEQMKQVTSHVVVMREMTARIADRSRGNALDFLGFGKELIALGADQSAMSPWATGGGNGFQTLKQTFRGLSSEFSAISDKHMLQATREDEGIVEQLNLLYDLLQAFHDLCDRHERGVLREHHSALKKYGVMKNKRMAATIHNSEQGAIDKIESKIVAQENEIVTQENRNYYSLHCIHLETQLVHGYLQILAEVITMLVATQAKGHKEISALWETLTPRVSALLPDNDSPPSPRPISPDSY